jgi:hypothetical protein
LYIGVACTSKGNRRRLTIRIIFLQSTPCEYDTAFEIHNMSEMPGK